MQRPFLVFKETMDYEFLLSKMVNKTQQTLVEQLIENSKQQNVDIHDITALNTVGRFF